MKSKRIITLIMYSRLYRITARCLSFYSKTSVLSPYNLFTRNYTVLTCDVRKKIHLWNIRNLSNSTQISDAETFQQNIIMLQKSIMYQYVKLKNFLQIVTYLENTNCELTPNLGKSLLNCCGKIMFDASFKTKETLANHVWELLEKKQCKLTLDHYHALLQAYIDNESQISPIKFLETMTIKPQYDTYRLLLKVVANTGDFQTIETCMAKMRKEEIPLTEEIYSSLIYAYATTGNITKIREILNNMENENIPPSYKSKSQLIFAFAKNNNFEGLMTLLRSITIDISDIMKLVKFLSLLKHETQISSVLRFVKPLEKVETDVLSTIVQLVRLGFPLDAYTIVTEIPISIKYKSLRNTFAFVLLKEMVRSNTDPKVLFNIANNFVMKQNMVEVWKKIVQFALEADNQMLAFMIFEEMKAKGITIQSYYYWPLLLHASTSVDENNIYEVIKHMMAVDVTIDSNTFLNYIFPYINTNNPINTVNKMKFNGIAPIYVIEPFMNFLLRKGRVSEGLKICKVFKKKVDCQGILNLLIMHYKISKDISHCEELIFKLSYNGRGFAGTFLRMFVDRIDINECDIKNLITFLITMKQHKALMSETDVIYVQEGIFDKVQNEQQRKYISQLLLNVTTNIDIDNCNVETSVHPEYMNEKQLNAHLYELQISQKNTRGVLRKLLLATIKKNDVEQVNELVAEINYNNFEWSPSMKATLFNFYTKNKKLDKAMVEFKEIQSSFPTFEIDNFKILEFVILLVQNDKIEEAFDIIQKCTNVNHKPNAVASCVLLLSLLANSSHFIYTEKMVNLLIEKGYCTYSTNILNWLVFVPIRTDNIVSAVNVFKDCVIKYKIAPERQELLTQLVKCSIKSPQAYDQLLQEVYSLIVACLGKSVAVTNLAISLAQCHKIEQLQTLFKNENISTEHLLQEIKQLNEDEIVKTALTILEVGGKILQIDLEPLCNLVLTICYKRSYHEQATMLNETMQKIGVTPSTDFQKTFTALISEHKPQILTSDSTLNKIILEQNKQKNISTST
ncbi:leucine-rich PPR motif-containing protein, mitochondrial-like [Calliopsis andreniformis]|uniref:leucine-rich PPR motif-containing protein, mitochondrial-like n=1 Tax=Calliopsis andreniformis TaxID=337506 RepID=UPI003FCECDAA